MLLWVRYSSPFASREPVGEASLKLWTSDGTFLYPYDNRMYYIDTLIEKF